MAEGKVGGRGAVREATPAAKTYEIPSYLCPTEEIVEVPIESITLHPENPRRGNVGAIYVSMGENGMWGTIVVQRSTGYVLKGNHTYRAALLHKRKTVRVEYADVDDAHAYAIMLADNNTSDEAENDAGKTRELAEKVLESTGSLMATTYTPDDLDALLISVAGIGSSPHAGMSSPSTGQKGGNRTPRGENSAGKGEGGESTPPGSESGITAKGGDTWKVQRGLEVFFVRVPRGSEILVTEMLCAMNVLGATVSLEAESQA